MDRKVSEVNIYHGEFVQEEICGRWSFHREKISQESSKRDKNFPNVSKNNTVLRIEGSFSILGRTADFYVLKRR
jgi:hypothetical protein